MNMKCYYSTIFIIFAFPFNALVDSAILGVLDPGRFTSLPPLENSASLSVNWSTPKEIMSNFSSINNDTESSTTDFYESTSTIILSSSDINYAETTRSSYIKSDPTSLQKTDFYDLAAMKLTTDPTSDVDITSNYEVETPTLEYESSEIISNLGSTSELQSVTLKSDLSSGNKESTSVNTVMVSESSSKKLISDSTNEPIVTMPTETLYKSTISTSEPIVTMPTETLYKSTISTNEPIEIMLAETLYESTIPTSEPIVTMPTETLYESTISTSEPIVTMPTETLYKSTISTKSTPGFATKSTASISISTVQGTTKPVLQETSEIKNEKRDILNTTEEGTVNDESDITNLIKVATSTVGFSMKTVCPANLVASGDRCLWIGKYFSLPYNLAQNFCRRFNFRISSDFTTAELEKKNSGRNKEFWKVDDANIAKNRNLCKFMNGSGFLIWSNCFKSKFFVCAGKL